MGKNSTDVYIALQIFDRGSNSGQHDYSHFEYASYCLIPETSMSPLTIKWLEIIRCMKLALISAIVVARVAEDAFQIVEIKSLISFLFWTPK